MKLSDQHDPLELLRGANPASAVALQAEMTLEQHVGALDRAIALGAVGAEAPPTTAAPRRLTRPRLFGLTAIASAVAAAAALLLLGGSPVGPREPEFAGAAVKVAEANPRLLVEAPGWRVRNVTTFQLASGVMDLGNGDDNLSVSWTQTPQKLLERRGAPDATRLTLNQWYRTYERGCTRPVGAPNPPCRTFAQRTRIDVLGKRASLEEQVTLRRSGRESHLFTLVVPFERQLVSIRGTATSRDEFLGIIGDLHQVDVQTWLAAMPASVVAPLARPEIVDEILRGVPLPPALSLGELEDAPTAGPVPEVRASLMNAVTCGWLDGWRAALRDGSAGAENRALQAMSTAHDWPGLRPRDAAGQRSSISQAADQMSAQPGALLRDGMSVRRADGAVYAIRPAYAFMFACGSGSWHLQPGTAGTRTGFGPPPVPVAGPR